MKLKTSSALSRIENCSVEASSVKCLHHNNVKLDGEGKEIHPHVVYAKHEESRSL